MPIYAYSISAVRTLRNTIQHRAYPIIVQHADRSAADKIAQEHAEKTLAESEGWESHLVTGVELTRDMIEAEWHG